MLPRSARPTCRRTSCMKGISPEGPPGRFSSRAHSRNGSSCTRAFSSALLNEPAVFRLEAGHRLEVRAWPREHIARKAVSVVGGDGGRIGDDPSFHGLDHALNVSLGHEVEVPTFPLCQVPPRSGAQEALCIHEQHATHASPGMTESRNAWKARSRPPHATILQLKHLARARDPSSRRKSPIP